jgi:hypothetical protein
LVGNRAVFMMLGVLALFAIRPLNAAAPSGAPRQPTASLDLSMARQYSTTDRRTLRHQRAASEGYPVG